MTTPAALQRRRTYSGPVLLSFGFRPFFFGAALWAALGIPLWLMAYLGVLQLPTAFGALEWHVHEMIFGYAAAAIAGFLLTAIPNWTGRLPVSGMPLGLLALTWLAGRVAMAGSAFIGAPVAAMIDVAFLVIFAVVCSREIIAGKNWRNLRVLGVLSLLIAANVLFHVEFLRNGHADHAPRLGVAALIGLIMLVGGRIVPSFTRNWLARQPAGRMPAPFSAFDAVSLVFAGTGLAAWVLWPAAPVTGALLLAAAIAQGARLARWAGERTVPDRLVLVLHAGYLFVPVGFLLTGLSVLWPSLLPASAGIHAWTVGAIGLMTLAVMTRASLGHTGQKLAATPQTQVIYLLAMLAVLLRIAAAASGELPLLYAAAAAWVGAFGGFALVYGPLLIKRPPGWASGC